MTMADFFLSFANEQTIHNIIAVMIAIFAVETIKGALARFSRRIRSDSDPKNDHLADIADAAHDALDKVGLPKRK
jgi:hypothetical protein